jgi:hypothetical protein
MKAIARMLLRELKRRHPGEHNELKHALWMFVHDNKVRA